MEYKAKGINAFVIFIVALVLAFFLPSYMNVLLTGMAVVPAYLLYLNMILSGTPLIFIALIAFFIGIYYISLAYPDKRKRISSLIWVVFFVVFYAIGAFFGPSPEPLLPSAGGIILLCWILLIIPTILLSQFSAQLQRWFSFISTRSTLASSIVAAVLVFIIIFIISIISNPGSWILLIEYLKISAIFFIISLIILSPIEYILIKKEAKDLTRKIIIYSIPIAIIVIFIIRFTITNRVL